MDTNIDYRSLVTVGREKAVRNRDEALNYIRLDLGNLARILSGYHPLEILKMAFWEERRVSRTSKDENLKGASRLMPVVLQSVVQSDLYVPGSRNRNVQKKDWNRVLSICQDLARKLSRFLDAKTAIDFHDGKISADNVPAYRAALDCEFFADEVNASRIKGQADFSRAFLAGEDQKCMDAFGVSGEKMVDELEKLAIGSLDAIDRLREDSTVFKTMLMLQMAQIKGESGNENLDEEELRRKALLDPALYQESLRLQGQRDDFDLFRPDFYTSLPSSAYKDISAAPGTLDIDEYLFEKGLWPSTCCPMIDLGGYYFTFIGKSILGITLRVLKEKLGLDDRLTAAAENVLASVFVPTDVEGVYSFDGKKIDVTLISALGEVNPYANPELFESRLERRNSEKTVNPLPGHKLLIVDPDGIEPLRKIDEDVFSASLYFMLLNKDDKDRRRNFYRTIFGELQMDGDVEPALEELDDEVEEPSKEDEAIEREIEDDELAFEALEEDDEVLEVGDESSSDDVALDDDEREDEEYLNVSRFDVPADIMEDNRRRYDENHEAIEEALSEDVVPDDYTEGDLEDDYLPPHEEDEYVDDDEDEADAPLNLSMDEEDEVEPSAEDESEEVDEVDRDQLDFLDLLDEYDELETDDTDEDKAYGEDEKDKAEDLGFQEDETDDTDEDRSYGNEVQIAPVFNDILQSEIETEDRDDDVRESTSSDYGPVVISEPVRDNDVVEAPRSESYTQENTEEPDIPSDEELEEMLDIDDEESPQQETPDPEEDEEEKDTDFFDLDSDDSSSDDGGDEDEEDNLDVASADFFDIDDDMVEDDVSSTEEPDSVYDDSESGKVFAMDTSEESVSPCISGSAEDDGKAVHEEKPEDGAVGVLSPAEFVDDASSNVEKMPEEPVDEVSADIPGISYEGTDDDDIPTFTLLDPDDEVEPDTGDETSGAVLLPEEEFVRPGETDEVPEPEEEIVGSREGQDMMPSVSLEEGMSSSMIHDMPTAEGGSEDDAAEASVALESESRYPYETEENNSGNIVLEYEDDELEEMEDEASTMRSESVLMDEMEADERDKVFTMGEEDSVQTEPETPRPVAKTTTEEARFEDAAVHVKEETHTVDLENPKYSETIRQIAGCLQPDLGVFGSFIEKEERSVLDYFNSVVKQCWDRQCQDGKDKMFSIFEYDMSILLAKSKVHDALRETELMNNAGAVMYSKGKTEWNALVVYINRDYRVESAELRRICKEDFSPSNWKIVTIIGDELINRGQR